MPPDRGVVLRVVNRFGLFLLAVTLLVGFSGDVLMMASAQPADTNITGAVLQVSSTVVKTDYVAIVSNQSLNTSTIILNGALKNLVQLPAESLAVRLPDDRLAIKSSEETSILPEGSTVVYYDETPVVKIPQQEEVLAVSSVVQSPLQNFTTNTNFIQTIPDLDVYQVEVVFFELARERLDVSLERYTIDWGDGSTASYAADQIAVSHAYAKSGSYQLTMNVTDSLGFTYVTTQRYTVAYEGGFLHSSLWVNKNKGPLSAFLVGFGLLGVGLAVFTETGRYRVLVLFTLLLPFYSRIQKEDVLDQFVRGQIYGFIKTNPGVHYNQILRKVGVKNGTLSYHLGVLEKTELIQSRREGLKYRVFYPTGMSFPKSERFRLTGLQIRIIELLRRQPGMTQKELAKMLDQKPQTINYNMKVLDQANLVSVVKKGRRTTCFAVDQQQTTLGE
jgi:DNA-binding MarR family transcriptional regulator